ncbi:hypothetical protein [Streptomyces sp. NPDC048825]|uniref:hypothetical protein n=1 Tax=Streptomyces sp. NPDC048825 TaxID=3365592 RepID=UPI003713A78B
MLEVAPKTELEQEDDRPAVPSGLLSATGADGYKAIGRTVSTSSSFHRRLPHMGDFLHYSSDRAGITDLFTNAVRLCPPEREDPRHWLGPIGHGPPEQLLTFLHEVTHHWCFRSDVGQALLFLAARADMNAHALSALSDDIDERPNNDVSDDLWGEFVRDLGPLLRAAVEDPRSRLGSRLESVRNDLGLAVHDDVIRIQVALALLRPLAEGLALFAEFDAISRIQSEVWSPLPYSVALNFAGRERLAQGPHVEPFNIMLIAGELLSRVRSSPLALSRKASMLGSPLKTGSPLTRGSGGYLLGYLTVKSLWRHLLTQDFRLFAETDLSLMYMRSFFYDDLGLAALLVQPPISDCMLSTQRIIDHLQERITVFEGVRKADVRAYEEHVLSSGGADWVRRSGLLRSAAEDERDIRLMRRAREDIKSSAAAETFGFAASLAVERFNRIAPRRTYLTACSVPVRVTDAHDPPGALNVVWKELPILTIPAEDLVRETSEELTAVGGTDGSSLQLDIVLGTATARGDFLARGAVLCDGKRVMACSVSGLPEHQARIREEMVAGFRARDALLKESETLQKIAGRIVENDWGLRWNRDHVLGQLDNIVDQLYRPTALCFAREGTDLDALADRMDQRGLLSVLGSSTLLRNMTLLGLSAGLNAHESVVAEHFQELGLIFDDTLREAARLWETEGFPPRVVRSGGPDGWVMPFL